MNLLTTITIVPSSENDGPYEACVAHYVAHWQDLFRVI